MNIRFDYISYVSRCTACGIVRKDVEQIYLHLGKHITEFEEHEIGISYDFERNFKFNLLILFYVFHEK